MKSISIEKVIIFLGILLYVFIACLVSLHRFWQYNSFYLDLGIFDQAIWRISRFQPPIIDHTIVSGKIIFADHFNPSMLLFAPLFWFTDKTEILLIVQSVFVGLSAFIMFKIADKIIESKLVKFALLISYLGFIGLQNALISDFHDVTLVLLPLSLLFWSIINKKWFLYYILLIIILGFKESISGLGIGIGIYLLLKKRKDKIPGLITVLLSIIWGIVSTSYIIPFFSQGDYYYKANLPHSISEIISSFFLPVIKTKTILVSFATFGFLPLINISLLPAILENFFERFLIGSPTRWDLGLHYNAPLSPLMFMSALEVIKKIQSGKKFKHLLRFWSIGTIIIVIIFHRFIFHGPLSLAFHPAFYETTRANNFLDDFVKLIPTDGLIMTQQNIAPRFTHYCVIMLKSDYKKYNPDYIALDLRDGQNPNNFYPLREKETKELFVSLQKDSDYLLKKTSDTTFIFAKKTQKRDNKKDYCIY